ncbi:PKD domain-containing protein, partial [Bacteroidota bacterium]
MNNYLYRCIVNGIGGDAISNFARLTVYDSTKIITPPTHVTACENEDVEFTVEAEGDDIHYRWIEYIGFASSTIGTNTNLLTLNSISAGMNGNGYQIKIKGICGDTVSSNPVNSVLTVNTAPTIGTQPTSDAVCENGTTSFTVLATNAISYQWQIYNGSDWSDIIPNSYYSGTLGVLSVNDAILDLDGYQFRCQITNDCGTSTSNAVTLTVYELPNITYQPKEAEICEGSDTLFGILANGYNISYQWEVNDGGGWSNVSDGGIYSGATDDTLIITGATSAVDGYLYRCTVSGGCSPNDVSDEVQLIINTAPSITVQPEDSTICDGNDAEFSVVASGTISSYQWYENDGGGWSALLVMDYYSDVSDDTLTISGADTSLHGNQYYCEITGVCGDVNSGNATIYISESPEITTEPVNLTVCEGIDTSLSVVATGDNISYIWERYSGSTWDVVTDITGSIDVDNDSLHIINIDVDFNENQFRCIVNGTCDPPDTSYEAEISVDLVPEITYLDKDTALCEGNSVSFEGSAESDLSISYSWKIDNVVIGGETDTIIKLDNIMSSDEGVYMFEATNVCGTSDSTITLTVHAKPVIDLGNDLSTCFGDTAILDAGTAVSYLWNNDSTTSTIEVTESGIYSVTTTDAKGCENIDSITIAYNEPYNAQELALVTVNDEGDNVIVWERATDTSIVEYNIYREEFSNYINIGSVDADSGLNQFIDTNVATEFESYSYTITITDTCGNESDYAQTHTTMNCYIINSGTTNYVNWNDYIGANYSKLNIYRGTNKLALDSLTSKGTDIEVYIDASAPEGDVYYQIEVRLEDTVKVDSLGITLYEYSSAFSNTAIFAKPIAEFTAAKTEILIGDSIQFTDESDNSPTAWKWTFEGGSADDRSFTNPLVKYNVAGIFDVTLEVTNAHGDSTLVKEDYIKVIGIENASTALCYGESITLSVNDADYTYAWSTGATAQEITITPEESNWYYVTITNGGSSVVDSVNIQVSQAIELGNDVSICKGDTVTFVPGEYVSYNWNSGESTDSILSVFNTDTIDLVVEDNIGCIYEDTVIVTLRSSPSIDLGEDVTACYGETVYLNAGVSGLTYEWNTTETGQIIAVDTTGIYIVTATNEYGCSDVDTANVLTKVPYANQEIFIVTVDTSEDKNMILWDKADDAGIDSFKIYKETVVANEYKVIGKKAYNQYNYFIDEESDPKVQSAKYKISVIDECGNESALSDHHKTIHLTSNIGLSEGDTVMNLIWNHYDGFTFGTYNIYRGSSENSLTLIGQKAADFEDDLNSYTDSDPIREGISYYLISISRGDTLYRTGTEKASAGPYAHTTSNMEDNRLRGSESTNEAPTDITLSANQIAENKPAGTSIGELSTDDPNDGDIHVYSFISGTNNNSSFSISENVLYSGKIFDYETKSSYMVSIRTTDTAGASYDEDFTISITDVDEVGIEVTSIDNNHFSILPNPFVYSTVIRPNKKGIIIREIEVYNTSGVVVKQFADVDSDQFVLKKDDLEPGSYYIKVTADDVYFLKLILQ